MTAAVPLDPDLVAAIHARNDKPRPEYGSLRVQLRKIRKTPDVIRRSALKTSSVSLEPFKYRGFISYAREDEAFAEWLQTSLEHYRIHRRLVGRDNLEGKVPRRLYPIYRDKAETSASADLGAAIGNALHESHSFL